MADEKEAHRDATSLESTPGKLSLPKRAPKRESQQESTEQSVETESPLNDASHPPSNERKRTGGRYVVTPKADSHQSRSSSGGQRAEKAEHAPRGTPRGRRGPGAGSSAGGGAGKARGRGKVVQKRLPDDPDHQWLKKEIKSAETVAHVIARKAQFENKIRALKLRYPSDRPLYYYAERMEQLIQRLQTYPWTALLRDIRCDDEVVKRLKL